MPVISKITGAPFRFWCQKVLPAVYDDSLSYYELLCKVVDYLNKVMEDDINVVNLVNQLEEFVNDYFTNLDVQEEINNKLDAMAEDGSLLAVVAPHLDEIIGDYEETLDADLAEYKGTIDEDVTEFKSTVNNALTAQNATIASHGIDIVYFKNTVNGQVSAQNTQIAEQDNDISVMQSQMSNFIDAHSEILTYTDIYTATEATGAHYNGQTFILTDPFTDYNELDIYWSYQDTVKTIRVRTADLLAHGADLSWYINSPAVPPTIPAPLTIPHLTVSNNNSAHTELVISHAYGEYWSGLNTDSAARNDASTNADYDAGSIIKVVGINYQNSAELTDIRVGYDGTVYDTAGNAVRGQVSDLNNTLDDLDETINGEITSMNYTEGRNIDADGSIVASPTVSVSDKIPYTWTGSTRYYCGDTTQTIYKIAFYDSSDNLLAIYQNPSDIGGAEYRSINAESVVSGTVSYVRFSFKRGYTGEVRVNASPYDLLWSATVTRSGGLASEIETVQSDVAEAKADIEELQNATLAEVTRIEEVQNITWTPGYVNRSGTIAPSETYVYSSKIPVVEGNVVRSSSIGRYITAYENDTAVRDKGVDNASEYVVPAGITALVFSIAASESKIITIMHDVTVNSLTSRVEALENTVNESKNAFTVKAQTLSNGTITALESVDTRKNMDIDFRADITNFSSVTVGHGYMINYGAWAVVDGTNITIYANQGGAQIEQYAHGLTIDHYVHVLIQQGDNTKASIIVESASGRFKQENVTFDSRRGDFYATVAGSFTNVYLTAVIKDMTQSIWMFGDSYQSIGDPKRYPYYMAEDGYINNCLMSGFPGAQATHEIASFRKLILTTRPKYVVWCMGMNGADSSTEINANWKTYTDEVIATCEAYGVTVILATIPNVPDRIQTFKNDYVRASGKQYIDFARAVGAESQGSTWYTDMLSSDNLHPTETGAIALYSELLADFPDIML